MTTNSTSYIDVAIEALGELGAKCFPVQPNKIPYEGYKWTDPANCTGDPTYLRKRIEEGHSLAIN